MPVLESLAANKNPAEHNSGAQPANHLSLIVVAEAGLRAPDRKAARKKTNAEQPSFEQVQRVGVQAGLRAGVKKKKSKNQHAEKATFRGDERNDARLVFLRFELVNFSFASNNGIGTIGIRDIPERPAAANRRQRTEILMRRRRSGRPFECPGVPG